MPSTKLRYPTWRKGFFHRLKMRRDHAIRPTVHMSKKKPAVPSHVALTVSLLALSLPPSSYHSESTQLRTGPSSSSSSDNEHEDTSEMRTSSQSHIFCFSSQTLRPQKIPGGLGRAPSRLSQPGSSEAFGIRLVGEGLRVRRRRPRVVPRDVHAEVHAVPTRVRYLRFHLLDMDVSTGGGIGALSPRWFPEHTS